MKASERAPSADHCTDHYQLLFTTVSTDKLPALTFSEGCWVYPGFINGASCHGEYHPPSFYERIVPVSSLYKIILPYIAVIYEGRRSRVSMVWSRLVRSGVKN